MSTAKQPHRQRLFTSGSHFTGGCCRVLLSRPPELVAAPRSCDPAAPSAPRSTDKLGGWGPRAVSRPRNRGADGNVESLCLDEMVANGYICSPSSPCRKGCGESAGTTDLDHRWCYQKRVSRIPEVAASSLWSSQHWKFFGRCQHERKAII